MSPTPVRLAIFASGTGTNAEAIMDHFRNHHQVSVALILTNNAQAGVLARAEKYQVPSMIVDAKKFRETEEVNEWLKKAQVTHIVLAGFLLLVPAYLLKAFPNRIINVHPSLLPKYGGKGMYGRKVHEAVKAAGDRSTGMTIHEVNEQFDEGRILFRAICSIDPSDSADTVARKVNALEHVHYPRIIENWALQKPFKSSLP